MAIAPASNDSFQTSDTVLATYLVIEGFALQKIDYRGEQGFFVFGNHNSQLADSVHLFNTLQARVEPNQFQQTYRLMIQRVTRRLG